MVDERARTRVIFRRYKAGDVVAILLDVPANLGYVTCYAHVGQHDEGHYFRVMGDTRPATAAEYAALARELDGRGYDLVLRKRRTIVRPGVTRARY